MARVFVPIVFKTIKATGGYHPANTTYKCSIGREVNDRLVYKIQLLYNGKIQPRTIPSFTVDEINPDNSFSDSGSSQDLTNIMKALKEVQDTYASLPDSVKRNATDIDITEND